MARRKKEITVLELEDIPSTLQKIVGLMDREIDSLSQKGSLTPEDSKNLISYAGALSTIYKDHRAEVLAIQKDLKTRSKEEIMAMISADGKVN